MRAGLCDFGGFFMRRSLIRSVPAIGLFFSIHAAAFAQSEREEKASACFGRNDRYCCWRRVDVGKRVPK